MAYKLVFKTDRGDFEFVVPSLKELEENIILKGNKPKYVMWFKGQRKGRIYYGYTRQLDFEIKKVLTKKTK